MPTKKFYSTSSGSMNHKLFTFIIFRKIVKNQLINSIFERLGVIDDSLEELIVKSLFWAQLKLTFQ